MFGRSPQIGLRVFIFLMLSISLMAMDYHDYHIKPVRHALNTIVYPILYSVNLPKKMYYQFKSAMISHEQLMDENKALRAKEMLLELRLQKSLSLEAENKQLRALLSSSKYLHTKVKIAQIISIPSNPSEQEVVIDQGSENDIFVNQPVLDASGVMGQVVQVNPLTSLVMLLTDVRSSVPVESTRNGMRAIAEGEGYAGTLRLMHVAKTSDIKVGDIFVTSGLGGVFPLGYPVGKVIAVNEITGRPFLIVTLLPDAKLNQTLSVLLVWPQAEVSL